MFHDSFRIFSEFPDAASSRLIRGFSETARGRLEHSLGQVFGIEMRPESHGDSCPLANRHRRRDGVTPASQFASSQGGEENRNQFKSSSTATKKSP
jgi:uncharacterized protein (DUF3084 family)